MSWPGSWGCDSNGLEPGLLTVSSTLPTLQPRPAFPLKVPLEICKQRRMREPDPAPQLPSDSPESAVNTGTGWLSQGLSETVYMIKLHYFILLYGYEIVKYISYCYINSYMYIKM